MTAEIIDISEARQNRKDLQEEPEADPGKAETFRLLAQIKRNLGLPLNYRGKFAVTRRPPSDEAG